MTRLSFVFTLILISCGDSSKEFEPSVYQMSEADSVRCMEEILDGIRFAAEANQREEDRYLNQGTCCFFVNVRPTPEVRIDSFGRIHTADFELSNLTDTVFRYFSFNRNLTHPEIAALAMDANYEGFDCPFYNQFSLKEIESRISKEFEQYETVSETPSADPALIEYCRLKVDEWKEYKNTLKVINAEYLPQLPSYIRFTVTYVKPSRKSEKILGDVSLAFYQLRNEECKRYFGETYLQLYERYSRTCQELDLAKLEAIDFICPIKIFDKNLQKSPPSYCPEPILIEAP